MGCILWLQERPSNQFYLVLWAVRQSTCDIVEAISAISATSLSRSVCGIYWHLVVSCFASPFTTLLSSRAAVPIVACIFLFLLVLLFSMQLKWWLDLPALLLFLGTYAFTLGLLSPSSLLQYSATASTREVWGNTKKIIRGVSTAAAKG
mgnify:CR=1 FL=1